MNTKSLRNQLLLELGLTASRHLLKAISRRVSLTLRDPKAQSKDVPYVEGTEIKKAKVKASLEKASRMAPRVCQAQNCCGGSPGVSRVQTDGFQGANGLSPSPRTVNTG